MKSKSFHSAVLFLRASWQLIYFDLFLGRGNFAVLHDRVRRYPVRNRTAAHEVVEQVCRAIDMACICYLKPVLCLQRSTATVCLLKRYGVPATLVIGTQHVPFRAHAWVEVDGGVVNDKPYVTEIYAVLDRC